VNSNSLPGEKKNVHRIWSRDQTGPPPEGNIPKEKASSRNIPRGKKKTSDACLREKEEEKRGEGGSAPGTLLKLFLLPGNFRERKKKSPNNLDLLK